MAIKGARPDNRQVVPYLFVRDGKKAIEFYQRAFGAQVLYQSPMPHSGGIFAQIRIGESVLQVADEARASERAPHDPASPESLGGTSVLIEMYVDDVDALYKRAVDAGATPTLPPFDAFYGHRYGWVRDPFGHTWALATVKEILTPEEIDLRMKDFLAQMSECG
jgi:PhnB protein